MIRTVISLPDEDKRWLDGEAVREGVSMTELIRRAVSRLRSEAKRERAFESLLEDTSGIGAGEDGVAVQAKLRREWDGRPA